MLLMSCLDRYSTVSSTGVNMRQTEVSGDVTVSTTTLMLYLNKNNQKEESFLVINVGQFTKLSVIHFPISYYQNSPKDAIL